MAGKRLVDYVFLAGLPQDFHINSITKGSTERKTISDIPSGSNNIPTILESQISNSSDNSETTATTNSDEESLRLADESLFESIRASIVRFDNEREEFLKSLRRGNLAPAGLGEGFSSKTRLSILPSTVFFRNGSKTSKGGVDEGFSETDSLASSSASAGKARNNNKSGNDDLKRRSSYLNVVLQPPSTGNEPEPNQHPLKQKFPPRLLSRYPKKDYSKEENFPAYIPMFCFPNDIMLRESEGAPPTTYHGFVMTQEDGSKRYGVCLTTFEPIPEYLVAEVESLHKKWCADNMTTSEIEYANHLTKEVLHQRARAEKAAAKLVSHGNILTSDKRAEIEREKSDAEEKLSLYNELLQPKKLAVINCNKMWLPKCIGVISQLPWHDVLRDWLCAVAMPMVSGLKEKQSENYLPLERYVMNLVHEIPLPPPGKLQISISVNDLAFFCGRPALNQIPILSDYSLYPLFRCLSHKSILTIFEVALAEGRILLISSYPDMLYLAAHSITYLMYPLCWQGVFIPVLPARLMSFLQAPVPYIMGIERQYKGMDMLPEDACIVDLDKDCILIADPPIQIPSRQRKKLMQALEAYAPLHSYYNTPYGVPMFVQQAFPHGRFKLLCAKSKIVDRNKRITPVVGMPARAVPLAPAMTGFYDVSSPPVSPTGPFSFTSAPLRGFQRRMSNFTSTGSLFEGREGSVKSWKGSVNINDSNKSLKKNKNRFSSLAKNSITSLRSKTLNRNSVLTMNRSANGHAHKSSVDSISYPQSIGYPQSISPPQSISLSQYETTSLFDDLPERVYPEKEFLPREGHLMVVLPGEGDPDGQPGMSTWMLEGLACGICHKSLGLNVVYKCEGCSMVAHDECLPDITYPCTPACFDEAKVKDAFLRVFSSLLQNYRSYLQDGTHCDADSSCVDGTFFKKELFLKAVDREPFLTSLVNSQAFSHFIHERVTRPDDPEILHFDEIITAKLNRSKLRISKEDTLFLNDTSYDISETFRAMKPDDRDLNDVEYQRGKLPSSFDSRLMTLPRPVPSL